jgi:cytochrome c biogenesis protein CcdA/thiol-disulfide isomerase/thioredoxin
MLDIITVGLSFVAGLITVFAPCVLPLLPVILGGSLSTEDNSKKRPYIIALSLVVSLFLFTNVLKVSTVFIDIDPKVWTIGSGVLVVFIGLFMLFPQGWAWLMVRLGIEASSQKMLSKAYQHKNKTISAVLTGAALGPVFSSCSPTYGWVLATVIPKNYATGQFYLLVYCLGVAASLLAIGLLGRKMLAKAKWATNPHGWFQRFLAVLFILVGIFVATGWDKAVSTWLVEKDFLNLIKIEKKLVPKKSSISNSPSTASTSVPLNYAVSGTQKDPKVFNVEAYKAPEFISGGSWFNSSPLTLESLKGKVVLVDFWTYSCINCIRTLPYLQKWYDTYKDKGFVIIGVHAPEFAFEKVPKNVAQAIEEKKLTYPIVQDNNLATWGAYQNQYWPATYLVDKDGNVRRQHFGEGEYEVTEQAIRDLLAENGQAPNDPVTIQGSTRPRSGADQTPETYLGYQRGERFANVDEFKQDAVAKYLPKSDLKNNYWSIEGGWRMGGLESTATESSSKLVLNYNAKEVYLVMSGSGGEGSIKLNGELLNSSNGAGSDVNANGHFFPKEARLYKLVNTAEYKKGSILELTFPKDTIVNAFTFGG